MPVNKARSENESANDKEGGAKTRDKAVGRAIAPLLLGCTLRVVSHENAGVNMKIIRGQCLKAHLETRRKKQQSQINKGWRGTSAPLSLGAHSKPCVTGKCWDKNNNNLRTIPILSAKGQKNI